MNGFPGRTAAVLFMSTAVFRCSAQVLPGSPEDSTDVSVYENLQGIETMEEVELPLDSSAGSVEKTGSRGAEGPWDFRLRTRLFRRLSMARGYAAGKYAGNNLKVFNMVRISRRHGFTGGIVTEKDPGETDVADFVSFTLSTDDLLSPFSVILGDFRVLAGQGLVFGGTGRFGKGSFVTGGILRISNLISPALSADEIQFFRGAAAGFSFPPLSLSVMVSRRAISATNHPGEGGWIPDRSGYHRTEGEIGRRGNLTEEMRGCVLTVDLNQRVRLGLNLAGSVFSDAVRLSPYYPLGERTWHRGSLDVIVREGPVTATAEWEWWSGYPSGIAGVRIQPYPTAGFVLIHRRYAARSELLHGSGFGEGNGRGNETGTYAGVECRIVPGLRGAAYLDVYRSRVPATGVVFPERRLDRLVELKYDGAERVSLTVRYRRKDGEERKTEPIAGAPGSTLNTAVTVEKGRIDGFFRWGGATGSRFRLDHVRVMRMATGLRETGTAFSVSLNSRPLRYFTLAAGITLFDTDSYDAGIYHLEGGLPGSLSGTTLYGEGLRWYAACSCQISGKLLKVSIKYSCLRRFDVRTIGSGYDEIPSNVDEQAGIQVDIRF